jgi:FtsP/CotA-like multicopper oxidase with cupredoxin domain
MIQFKAVSAVLAFIALLAFQVVTPAYFLPPDAEIEMDYQGHLAGHDRPQLFCEPGESRNYALTLSEVRWEVAPGQFFTAWTFNGAIPGPTLCGYEGEALQVEITNRLDRGVEFSVAPAGETEAVATATVSSGETYALALNGLPSGTLVYRDTSEGGVDHGLYGAIVIYGNDEPQVDHDIVVFEDEFTPPVTDGDDFFAVLNGKGYPLNPHYIFTVDEVVRFRMVNIGSEYHTFHIHGHVWLDERGNNNDNEVLAPGEAVDGLVQMREPGSWMYHCHIYDHIAGGMTSMLTVLPAGFEGDPVTYLRNGGAH